jgi:hypothetical protein
MGAPKDLGKAIKAGYMPMFMTGPEIKEHFAPYEKDKQTIDIPDEEKTNRYEHGERKETDDELWDRKLKESKETTGLQRFNMARMTAPELTKRGVTRESTLESAAKTTGLLGSIHVQSYVGYPSDKQQLLGGHHRVALSAEQFPEHIFPVKYSKSIDEAWQDPEYL